MQDPKFTEENLKYEKALLLHTLIVKNNRTEAERLLMLQLLREQQELLELDAPDENNDVIIDCSNESVEQQSSPSKSDEPPARKPKVPTIASVVHKHANDGTVHMKAIMNKAYPGEQIGSQNTPVKPFAEITNSKFFLSPGGTTGFFEQTAKVRIKKISGGKFMEEELSSSEEESSSNSFSD